MMTLTSDFFPSCRACSTSSLVLDSVTLQMNLRAVRLTCQRGAASAETADKSLPPPEAPTEKKKEPSAASLPRHMRRGDGRKQPPVWMMYGVEPGTGTWALNRRKAENERGEEGHA